MRVASLVIGIIGSSIGLLCTIILLIQALTTPVTAFDVDFVSIVSLLALIMNILALTFSCISRWNNKLTGSIMLVTTVINVVSLGASIEADNPILFVLFMGAAIMLLIAGILRLLQEKQNNEVKALI